MQLNALVMVLKEQIKTCGFRLGLGAHDEFEALPFLDESINGAGRSAISEK
jgi:hypothetical protein